MPISDKQLPPATQLKLAEYQREIDSLANFADRVAAAKIRFSSRNRSDNEVFRVVRQTLQDMCSGVCRCMYCEDSLADQVEHFKPKDFYPDLVFVWLNYLYSCGTCNRRKANWFPIFASSTEGVLHLRRLHRVLPEPPEPGRAVLINPRQENPLDFLQMDIQETFRFQPLDPDSGSTRHQRASETIEILGLNSRSVLTQVRGAAFRAYLALLCLYLERRDAGSSPEDLRLVTQALQRLHHATVWAEMKRQRHQIPQLWKLFEKAPEALEW
ncbi:MAG TPA: hypothetical protein VF173_31890 [Thermoanaerobaculia bacterium]|nr:hypothetical protein [Thermoanaerobaculia bacterium]